MSESPRGVQVLAAGTQRGACDAERDRRDGRRWSDPPYRVQARVEVRVPANVTLRLCTVNGPASVTGVAGGVHVSAVNGPITASEIGGDVRLKTVNGNIDADVRARPGRPWDLATVNGNVLLRMPTDAAADLRLKTMHGGIYTDFETTELPATAPTVEQRGNLRVLRSNRSVGVRIGAGGPTVTIETVNGNVRVQRR